VRVAPGSECVKLNVNAYSCTVKHIALCLFQSWTVCVIVVMISGGLFLFTYKATDFNYLGFMLVLTASFTRSVMGVNLLSLLKSRNV
jgi:hypothetical protein